MGTWGVGMPASLLLDEFASQVWAAFGHAPYLVGSAMKTSAWRDVDVRLILPDDEYARWEFGDPTHVGQRRNGRWVSLCLAYSTLGKSMTGLPIDFQIQQQTAANAEFKPAEDHPRNALGFTPLRLAGYPITNEGGSL